MKVFKKHITLFYLILFIGIKFIDLHTYEHNDYESYEDCDICEYVESTDKTFYLVDGLYIAEQTKQQYFSQQFFNEYSYIFVEKYRNNSLFSRPPPVV